MFASLDCYLYANSNMIYMKYIVFPALLFLLLSCSQTNTDLQVYEWRGPDRSGIYAEDGLLKEWPEDGPQEILAIENIGHGYGSPVFVGERFYISGAIDSTATLFCFNLQGNEIWQSQFGPEWMKSFPGSRSAPTIAGDRIYISSGMGKLCCFDTEDGSMIWSKDLETDFDGIFPMHGHSEAIVVDRDRVFWTPGGPIHNVVALNRHNGELIWSNQGFSERSAYNPAKLIGRTDRKVFVTFSAYHLMGIDAETGDLLWSHEQDNYPPDKRRLGYGDTHSNAIVIDSMAIYYAAGDGNGGVRLNISDDGTSVDEVWRNPGFDSYMGGIVKIDNWLYGCGTMRPELRSIDAESGELIDSLNLGPGAVIAADNMLYYYSQRGMLNLIAYDKGNIELVSSFRVKKGDREHFSHPVIYRDVLYQRHGTMLLGYDISAEGARLINK